MAESMKKQDKKKDKEKEKEKPPTHHKPSADASTKVP